MLDSFEGLVFAFACGAGLILFGLGFAFFPARRDRFILAFASTAAAAFAAGAASTRSATAVGLVGVAGVGFVVVSWLWRTTTAMKFRAFLLRPVAVGVTAALTGAGVIGAGSWYYDYAGDSAKQREIEFIEKMSAWHPDLAVAEIETKTDRGTAIPVYTATSPRAKPQVREDEEAVLTGFDWAKRVIPRSPGDDVSNCHGWVFTGGKYWVKGHDVPTILKEHEYKAQRWPMVGDVAAYYDKDGKIAHTGIVRSVGAVTMVESKWGWMGVYLHAAAESCYGANVVYFRGPRKGHQFAAIKADDADPKPRFGFDRGMARPPVR